MRRSIMVKLIAMTSVILCLFTGSALAEAYAFRSAYELNQKCFSGVFNDESLNTPSRIRECAAYVEGVIDSIYASMYIATEGGCPVPVDVVELTSILSRLLQTIPVEDLMEIPAAELIMSVFAYTEAGKICMEQFDEPDEEELEVRKNVKKDTPAAND
jgi:hypothetical protein